MEVEKRRGLRYRDVPKNTLDLVHLTSLYLDEFLRLLPHFEAAFQEHMRAWTTEGQPRKPNAPPFKVHPRCPLPTPEDRLLFVLSYLKSGVTQFFHGYLFGMNQPQTYIWLMRLLLPSLEAALAKVDSLPASTMEVLQRRLSEQELSKTQTESLRAVEPASQPQQDLANEAAAQAAHTAPLAATLSADQASSQVVVEAKEAAQEKTPQTLEPAQPREPAFVFCHDATERPIARPKANQKIFYSGKKKGIASRT